MPKLKTLRSKSVLGLSSVVLLFEQGTNLVEAQVSVQKRVALEAARDVTEGRLLVVFGCGGDRDATKRPLMGEIAANKADFSILTSDNPRGEDPAAIISDVLSGFPTEPSGQYTVETDRRAAIAIAFSIARVGDVVLIAGKGHEVTQTLGTEVRAFDDRVVARELLEAYR